MKKAGRPDSSQTAGWRHPFRSRKVPEHNLQSTPLGNKLPGLLQNNLGRFWSKRVTLMSPVESDFCSNPGTLTSENEVKGPYQRGERYQLSIKKNVP